MAHHGGELQLSAVLGHSHLSSALEGLECQEHVGHTPSLILKVDTLWLARLAGKRLSHLGQQLAGSLVEAHYGSLRRGPGSLPSATRTGRCTRVGSPTA